MPISFSIKKATAENVTSESILSFALNKTLSASASYFDKSHGSVFSQKIKKNELKLGQSLSITVPGSKASSCQQLLLTQLSTSSKGASVSKSDFVSAIKKTASKLLALQTKELTICLDDLSLTDEATSAHIIAQTLSKEVNRAAYRYTTTLGQKPAEHTLKKITLTYTNPKDAKALKSGIVDGCALANGINFARELGNLPGNHCTPLHLTGFAKALASEHKELTVKVLGQKAMERLKMGSLLSVSKGSDEEPQFIIFEYKGKTSSKPQVIVGKGITFDTGGISLKPGAAMDEMKFDMCGAASVFGTIKSLAQMKAKAHVIGVIVAAENMPSGGATKPGDVVTSMSGQTIEVLNTDAEGRLVLCDALTYVERFKPKSVIDIATLTGACVITLGSHATGLFSNNQALAGKLLAAGEATGDRAWQMPLWDEYHRSLKSNFADIANIGGREGGSITAACFLSKFTKKYAWAHLDIAGSAWNSGAAKGATGRPVELLVEHLITDA